MNISKVLLWATNILIVGSTIFLISFFVIQTVFSPVVKEKTTRDLRGTIKISEMRNLTTHFFDLDYFFIYRDGEVLIDNYVISSKHFNKAFDYEHATKGDFLEIQTASGKLLMPNISEKLSIPVPEEHINFYINLARAIIIATWFFFFIQLVWIRKLIKNTIGGRFFDKANIQVLLRLGYLYIALPIVIMITEGMLDYKLLPDGLVLPEGYGLVVQSSNFQFQYLFVGLMLLLISQAFKEGLNLQKEQELTV